MRARARLRTGLRWLRPVGPAAAVAVGLAALHAARARARDRQMGCGLGLGIGIGISYSVLFIETILARKMIQNIFYKIPEHSQKGIH